MSALDKSPGTSATIYKVSAETAIAHTECRIGGAGAVVEVPASCDTLLGIYAHLSTPLPTDNEMVIAWGYLDSEDGFNIKPFEFLFPPAATSGAGGAAVGMGDNSTPGEFYPINCPVVPGGRIAAYGQTYSACTEDPYVGITYMFGKNIVLPKSMDDHPGRHRWRKVSHTSTTGVATGYAPETQYQFTLSAIGGAITEVGGLLATDTQDPTQCTGGATLQINSADVPVMPMDFCVNAFGAVLGAADSHDMSHTITRRPCSAFGEKVVHIDPQLVLHGSASASSATMEYVSMVEFVRRGE